MVSRCRILTDLIGEVGDQAPLIVAGEVGNYPVGDDAEHGGEDYGVDGQQAPRHTGPPVAGGEMLIFGCCRRSPHLVGQCPAPELAGSDKSDPAPPDPASVVAGDAPDDAAGDDEDSVDEVVDEVVGEVVGEVVDEVVDEGSRVDSA
ncbi:MAG: hypothetical protein ACYCV7_16065, partial [Acidimicrobiales bacterium]